MSHESFKRRKGDRLQGWITASLFLAGALVMFGFIAGWAGYRPPRQQGENFLQDLGNYGSYLQGTVASLWALAGVFLVLAAFLGQKQQLLLQREELEITRNQLEEQKRQSDEQNRGIRLQNFESHFFQMLTFHHRLVDDMVDGNLAGRDCFRAWYERLGKNRASLQDMPAYMAAEVEGKMDERKFSIEIYNKLYCDQQGNLGHYFRNLYHIIKFVHTAKDMTENEKRAYTTLVRAQLSAYEQALLFYNGIHPAGDKFHPLIEEYSLLHNFDRARLLFSAKHKDYYAEKAYEGSSKGSVA